MNQYSKRRSRLLETLPENAAVILFAGKAPMRSEDEAYEFSINRNFYYLTGLDKENMVLVMYRLDGTSGEHLFIPPYDEKMARWVGGRMLKEEAAAVSEIKKVEDVGDLDSFVASLLNRNRRNPDFTMFFDFWHYEFDQSLSLAQRYANKLKENYPALAFKDVYPALAKMRLVKDEQELESIRKAIHITNNGILKMMKSAKPGMNEMTLEGIFSFVLAQMLCHRTAFGTIAAGGKRATILHYHDNNRVINDNELFLCDLGATSDYYCADISRTFPINGHFSDRQKEIYQLVRNAQKIVEANAKPGVKLKDLNQMVIDYYKQELPKHGLNEAVSEYYFHSCGHHLGLDTHDIDGGLGAVLKEGNVITNEPGLYITAEGIGIRIEDDLLITADGCEVLSKEIIREAEDIERYMNGQ